MNLAPRCALVSLAGLSACMFDWTVPPEPDPGAGGDAAAVGSGGTGGQAGGGAGGSGSPECAPDEGDHACTACLEASCCEELVGCVGDAQCACRRACYDNPSDGCLPACGEPRPGTPGAALDLCAAAHACAACFP